MDQQIGKAQGTYGAKLIKARVKQPKTVRILHQQIGQPQGARQQFGKAYETYQSVLVQARVKQTNATNKSRRILFVSTAAIMTTLIVMTLLVSDSHPSVPSSSMPSSALGGNAIPVPLSASTTPTPASIP